MANDARVESVFSAGRLPTKFHTDLLHSLCCNAVIDLFAGQGEMAQACLDTRTPIVAFCCTEAHAEALEERLTKYVLTKFTEKGHTLHREDAKNMMVGADGLTSVAAGSSDGLTSGHNPDPKAKPKSKKRKKNKDEESEEEESEEEESDDKKKKKKKQTKKKKSDDSDDSEEEDANW